MIWVGTWNGGLNLYDSAHNSYKTFYHSNDKNSLPNDIVLCMMEDSEKQLWVGTYNGLALYDKKNQNFRVYKSSKDDNTTLSFNDVSALCEDKQGYLWVGTWGGGLNRLDRKSGKFKQYIADPAHSNGLMDQIITNLFVSKNGTLYIGTAAGGLHIYLRNFDKFYSFRFDPSDSSSISSNSIDWITEDGNGIIWIGTAGGGLNRFDPQTKKFKYFSEKDGLADNTITSILIDDFDNFWLSTSKGLTSYNPQTRQMTNYDYSDGIGNTQFVSAAGKGEDGKLMFGGKNGVTLFYPSNADQPEFKPSLVILNFNILDQPLKLEKEFSAVDYIELNHNDNTFSIDFAALNVNRPDKIRYAYMLEGFDNNWVISDKRRTAYYTNLDPGTYTFRIKASIDVENWVERKATLTIYIVPPFWQRWWFILLTALIFVLIFYSIYQYRVNSLLKIERLRIRIASDLHDELASNLSSIAMFGNIIQQENQEKKNPPHELLDRIINLSQDSVVSIREIIWAINPKVETIQNLLIKIRDSIVVSCRAKNIKLEFDIPDEQMLSSENLSPEIRRDLWMLLKEALTNSIKHSGCSELKLIALYDGHLMRIVIKDNGKGFDSKEKYSGHGLVNMKRRAANLNAEIEISSEKNEGTTIILSFKV
jgi:two-component sensor histidine kinase